MAQIVVVTSTSLDGDHVSGVTSMEATGLDFHGSHQGSHHGTFRPNPNPNPTRPPVEAVGQFYVAARWLRARLEGWGRVGRGCTAAGTV